jgi:hypothetical protein
MEITSISAKSDVPLQRVNELESQKKEKRKTP